MEHKSLTGRSINRIGYIMPKIKRIWHYYPELSFRELMLEITLAANEVESEFPLTSIDDIEDIAYPEGHYLHKSRSLEMGIEALEKQHENEPLPPVPIQTATLSKVGDLWRNIPQRRLGQILSTTQFKSELEGSD